MNTVTEVKAHKEFQSFEEAKVYWATQRNSPESVFGSFVPPGSETDVNFVVGVEHLSLTMLRVLQDKQELLVLVKFKFEYMYDKGLGLKHMVTANRACISIRELNEVQEILSKLPKFELLGVSLGTLDKDVVYLTIPNYYKGDDLTPDELYTQFFHLSNGFSAQKKAIYTGKGIDYWRAVDCHYDGSFDLFGTIEEVDGFDKRIVIPYGVL